MSDTNPFEDVERGAASEVAAQLEKVLEIDRMEDIDVTSWEAEFLDSAIKQLRAKRPLSPGQIRILGEMRIKYGF